MNIQEYIDSDKQKVQAFMQEIFLSERMRKGNYFNRECWRWQYQGSPYGKAITMLAKDGEDIVGQYANIPVNIKCYSTTLISSITVDLMVKKNYRRQGLFKKMAEAANDRLIEAGVALSFAFPSRDESYSGFVSRLGWFRVSDLKIMAKPVLPRFFGKKYFRDEIRIEKIESFSDEADILWNRLRPLVKIGIVRNKEYLNWRYFNNPVGNYEVYMAWRNNMPAGYCVLKTIKFSKIKVGVIVDLFCIDALDVVKALVSKAEKAFLRQGAFVCVVLKNRAYEDKLKAAGFKILPEKLSPKNYTLIARTNIEGMDLAGLMEPDSWFVNFGDWDVV